MDQMFFFNKENLEAYQHASGGKKDLVAGSGYVKKILNFIASHYICGELFMEYIIFACKNDDIPLGCEYCSKHNWIGPPMERVPQQIPDAENPGYFLNVFKTPTVKMTGCQMIGNQGHASQGCIKMAKSA